MQAVVALRKIARLKIALPSHHLRAGCKDWLVLHVHAVSDFSTIARLSVMPLQKRYQPCVGPGCGVTGQSRAAGVVKKRRDYTVTGNRRHVTE